MKIDSSYIGMESGRTYQSRSTGKLSFRVQMGSTNNDSPVNGGLSNNEDVLNQEHALDNMEQELTDAQGKLNQTAGIRRIPYANRVEEYNALEDIRQQCILYLWTIFFGKSRANEMADKMGVRLNTGQQGGNNSFYKNNGVWDQGNAWAQTGTIMQGQVQTLQTL